MIIIIHELKIDQNYFEDIVQGLKKFEIRKNDRGFSVNDRVILREITESRKFTGRELAVRISYLTDYEQKDGYVVFGFEMIK